MLQVAAACAAQRGFQAQVPQRGGHSLNASHTFPHQSGEPGACTPRPPCSQRAGCPHRAGFALQPGASRLELLRRPSSPRSEPSRRTQVQASLLPHALPCCRCPALVPRRSEPGRAAEGGGRPSTAALTADARRLCSLLQEAPEVAIASRAAWSASTATTAVSWRQPYHELRAWAGLPLRPPLPAARCLTPRCRRPSLADSFLTHDSPAVRKQHNTGYKHKSNVKSYYLQVLGWLGWVLGSGC